MWKFALIFADISGNGYIDANDLTEVLKAANLPLPGYKARELIQSLTSTGNGRISFDEFISVSKMLFISVTQGDPQGTAEAQAQGLMGTSLIQWVYSPEKLKAEGNQTRNSAINWDKLCEYSCSLHRCRIFQFGWCSKIKFFSYTLQKDGVLARCLQEV